MSISDRLDQIEQDARYAAECWQVGRSKFNTESNAEIIDGALANGESMLAAFRAVLDLHQPVNKVGSAVCEECDPWGHYPCPTVRAVTAALGKEL